MGAACFYWLCEAAGTAIWYRRASEAVRDRQRKPPSKESESGANPPADEARIEERRRGNLDLL